MPFRTAAVLVRFRRPLDKVELRYLCQPGEAADGALAGSRIEGEIDVSMKVEQIGAGIACLANHDLWSALDTLRAEGICAVELLAYAGARHSIGKLPGFWFDELSAEEFDHLRRTLAAFDGVSVHAPFTDAPLFTYNRGIAREALRQVAVAIEGCGRIGGTAVAVHANRRPLVDLSEYWSDMIAVFRELGDVARASGVVVGIETGFPNRIDQFLRLIREVDHPAVGATVDIGHVAFYAESEPRCTPEGVTNFNRALIYLIEELGERLVHVHVHDVRLADWRDHRALGTGVIDVPAVVRGLDRLGYQGLLQFELEEPAQLDSLRASRHLLTDLISAKVSD
jgi:sugar phosphate isomerase/epimerase